MRCSERRGPKERSGPEEILNHHLRRRLWASVWVFVPLAVMLLAAKGLLSEGAFALSDHPDRLARMINARQMIVDGRDPFGWVQEIFGGYPDLQFYPPGPSLLGGALGLVLGLNDERAYWLLVVIVYLAPALTVTLSLIFLNVRPHVAALAGVVAGYMAFGVSGTVVGAGYGTLGSRLSLAIAPVVVVAFAKIASGATARRGLWTLTLATSAVALILSHPYHFPATLVVAAAAAWGLNRDRKGGVIRAWTGLAAGVFLAGVWWAGLLLMRRETIPFLWGKNLLQSLLNPPHSRGWDWWLICAAVAGGFLLARGRLKDPRFVLFKAAGPLLLLVAFMMLIAGPLRISYFDPYRVLDDIFFWFAVMSVLWIEALPRLRWTRALSPILVGLLGLGWIVAEHSVLGPEERFALRLEGPKEGAVGHLWAYLAGHSGRVVFTSSTYGSGATHIFGLTGVFAEREFIGGTSTHPSPMQAYLMYGPGADTVRDFANDFDHRSIFGISWADVMTLDAAANRLAGYLETVGAAEIVAEGNRLPFQVMSRLPNLFSQQARFDDLAVFRFLPAKPGRIVAIDSAEVTLLSSGAKSFAARIDAKVRATILVRVIESPYWTASLDGRPLATRPDEFDQMLVRVPTGSHLLQVTYELPWQVRVARVLSALGGLILLLPYERFLKRFAHRFKRETGRST